MWTAINQLECFVGTYNNSFFLWYRNFQSHAQTAQTITVNELSDFLEKSKINP